MRWFAVVLVFAAACDDEVPIFPDNSRSSADVSTGVGASDATATSSGSGGAPPSPGFESGSRLRARLFVGQDGSRQFAGWHDTALDADCAFMRASDEKLRCVPVADGLSGLFYADAGCTQRTIHVAKGCDKPAYAHVYGAGEVTCTGFATNVRVHPPGELLLAVYSGSPANCALSAASADYDVYELGAEVPATTFQLGAEEIE